MKNSFKIYGIGLLIILYSIINLLYFFKKFTLFKIELILMAFMILLFIFVRLLYGYPKKNIYNRSLAIKSIVTILLLGLVISYLLGLLTGFSYNIFFNNIAYSIELMVIVAIVTICKELVRYIIAQNSTYKKFPIVILTISYIILELSLNFKSINTLEELFLFTSVTFLPIVAKELLASYLNYNFGLITVLVYMIPINIYQYILPIFPNLGDYINSVLHLFMPFLIYMTTIKIVKYNNKQILNYNSNLKFVLFIPLFLFLVLIIVLVSGIFKYKMIAIASNSMNPIFYRGDAVIYEKITDINSLKVGDILVFKKYDYVITHRIVSINNNNEIYIRTKGDNNEILDGYYVYPNEVLGVIKSVVKYVGYPTVWITEVFKGE